uniref:Uncharacterized protein n=1 Tax=Oryza sativa subsp. japonica TaxID=39947 RepID=Q53RC2_ORYSJ|nr:hypothetical protein [Oryza sativa Japonica Group]
MEPLEVAITIIFDALLLVFMVKLFFAMFQMKLVVILFYLVILLFAMAFSGRAPSSFYLRYCSSFSFSFHRNWLANLKLTYVTLAMKRTVITPLRHRLMPPLSSHHTNRHGVTCDEHTTVTVVTCSQPRRCHLRASLEIQKNNDLTTKFRAARSRNGDKFCRFSDSNSARLIFPEIPAEQ